MCVLVCGVLFTVMCSGMSCYMHEFTCGLMSGVLCDVMFVLCAVISWCHFVMRKCVLCFV